MSWIVEDFEGYADSDSDADAAADLNSKNVLPEDSDEELRQIMNTAHDEIAEIHENLGVSRDRHRDPNLSIDHNQIGSNQIPSSSSNAKKTGNVQTETTTTKAGKIQQRRKSERLLALNQNKNANAEAEITTVPRRPRGRPKKQATKQQTNPKSSVTVTENQSDTEWKWKWGKRKISETQNIDRLKTSLSVSVWKYFTDVIQPQTQLRSSVLASSSGVIAVENTDDVDAIQPDGDAGSSNDRSKLNSKETYISGSAKCKICGEWKQFQKGCVWNLRKHLESVCSEFNFHPFS